MCGVPWANNWANFGYINFFSTYGFHVLGKRNGMEFQEKVMCLASGK